jgi:hypothetical protein
MFIGVAPLASWWLELDQSGAFIHLWYFVRSLAWFRS